MKNAFVALALVLCLSAVFAHKSHNTKSRLQKIAKTSFGQSILETIQVEIQTNDDPRPRLLEILAALEEGVIASQAEADADFKVATDRHTNFLDATNADLAATTESLTNNLQNQNDWSASLAEKTQSLECANYALADLQKRSDDADANRAAEQEAWEAADNKMQTIIDVLNQVRSVITQRLNSRMDSEFLQHAHKEIMGTFSQVKETVHSKAFKKLSPGFSKMVGFITMKVESALKQDIDADADATDGLTRIIDLIDSLLAGVQETKAASNDHNNQQKESYEAVHEDLTSQISTVTSNVDNLKNEISTLEGNLSAVAGDIERQQTHVAELNQQLVDESGLWADCDAKYSATTHDRTEQLDVLKEVRDIVENQLSGLRDYAENYIGSH
jgi:peptidoglycan hydrolase CwlO-like protein